MPSPAPGPGPRDGPPAPADRRPARLLAALRATRWGWLAPAAFYVGLAAWCYQPALPRLGEALIGQGDVLRNAWGYWWTRAMLFDHHALPIATNLLNYPRGEVILPVDLLNCLLSLPLQFVLGLPAGYNVFLVLSSAFGALGAFFLARYVTRSDAAALVAGALYSFCPFTFAAAMSGNSEVVNVGWLPLFLLFLLRALDSGREREGVAAGLLLSCTTLSNWYFGYFAVLLAGPIVAARLAFPGPGVTRRQQVRSLCWALLVFGVFTLELLFAYRDLVAKVSQAVQGEPIRLTVWLDDVLPLSTRPPEQAPPTGLAPAFYLPLATLVLGGLGLLATPRRAAPWALAAVLGLLLALGHHLQLSPEGANAPWSRALVTASATAYDGFTALPLSRWVRLSMRFMVVFHLGASLAAASGLAWILRPLRRPALALCLAAALALALVVQGVSDWRLHERFAMTPVGPSPSVLHMAADPEAGAVVYLPSDGGGGMQLYGQVTHGRPLLLSIDFVTSRLLPAEGDPRPSLTRSGILVTMLGVGYDLVKREWPPPRAFDLGHLPLEQDLDALRAAGLRFIVLDRSLYREEHLRPWDEVVGPLLHLERKDGEVELYRL